MYRLKSPGACLMPHLRPLYEAYNDKRSNPPNPANAHTEPKPYNFLIPVATPTHLTSTIDNPH